MRPTFVLLLTFLAFLAGGLNPARTSAAQPVGAMLYTEVHPAPQLFPAAELQSRAAFLPAAGAGSDASFLVASDLLEDEEFHDRELSFTFRWGALLPQIPAYPAHAGRAGPYHPFVRHFSFLSADPCVALCRFRI